MKFDPQFITVDDFLAYWGFDLNDKLKGNDNSSNKVNVFLYRVEQRLMQWIDANTFRLLNYDNLTPYQLNQFKLALLEQAMYMWKNGDLGMDSGYDPERGKIVDRNDLTVLSICEPALNCIKNAGLYNQKIQNRKRYMRAGGLGMLNEGGIPRKPIDHVEE